MITVVNSILENRFLILRFARHFLRLSTVQIMLDENSPLVCIVVGEASSGKSLSCLLESRECTNYEAVQHLLASYMTLARERQSDRERERQRYIAFVSGNYTPTCARRTLGIECMGRRALNAKSVIGTNGSRRNPQYGSLTTEYSDTDSNFEPRVDTTEFTVSPDTEQHFHKLLIWSNFNRFEFISRTEEQYGILLAE